MNYEELFGAWGERVAGKALKKLGYNVLMESPFSRTPYRDGTINRKSWQASIQVKATSPFGKEHNNAYSISGKKLRTYLKTATDIDASTGNGERFVLIVVNVQNAHTHFFIDSVLWHYVWQTDSLLERGLIERDFISLPYDFSDRTPLPVSIPKNDLRIGSGLAESMRTGRPPKSKDGGFV